MFKKLDFQKVSKDLNTLKDPKKEYSAKELAELCQVVGLPINSDFRKSLVENNVLNVIDRGKAGTFYRFNGEAIFYLNIEAAYRQHRKRRNNYMKNYNKPTSKASEKPATLDESDEDLIQAAIKLLKAQGDRFKITEKVVTVEFKDL